MYEQRVPQHLFYFFNVLQRRLNVRRVTQSTGLLLSCGSERNNPKLSKILKLNVQVHVKSFMFMVYSFCCAATKIFVFSLDN